MQQHPRQRVAIALAAGQHADPLEHVVFGEQEAARAGCAARFRRSAATTSPMIVEHPRVRIEFLVLILREVIGLDVVAELEFARGRAAPLRASSLISVDLPAPFTPTSAMRSPRSMMKFDVAEDTASAP